MSKGRRKNYLRKTLSTEDIHDVLDQYGSDSKRECDLTVTNNNPIAAFSNHNEEQFSDVWNKKEYTLQDEWDFLFHGHDFRERLKYQAFDGYMGSQNFRIVCWRVFWECLSENVHSWVSETENNRNQYNRIRSKYVIDPYEKGGELDINTHHPLSLAEDSVWNKYFQDTELRSTIMQDLDRLFPDIEFFQNENIKSMILHVLFCFARENPNISYKQGMHEIAGLLIYITSKNCQVVESASNEQFRNSDARIILDSNFIEHDSYILFANIMDVLEPWYTNLHQIEKRQNINKMSQEQKMFQNPIEDAMQSAISRKLNRIQFYMLKRYDSALCDHLRKIDVAPQLYGIRWIRLLFSREFSLSRVLVLWDAIFADGPTLDILDYIYIALLINLRATLLQSDFNTALTMLMKYPAETDTKFILKRAVTLKLYKPKVAQQGVNNMLTSSSNPIDSHMKRVGSKQQMYAQALGSGYTIPETQQRRSFAKNVIKSASPIRRKKEGNETEVDGMENNTAKTQFISDSLPPQDRRVSDMRTSDIRTQRSNSMASQISSFKNKVTSSQQQIISRIQKPLRNKQNVIDTDALIEDHARLQGQVSDVQAQLDRMNTFCMYCSNKMDFYITTLHNRLLKEEKFSDEIGILSIAGLKQVRDIMRNSVDSDWRASNSDYEIDFSDIDAHIRSATNGETSASFKNDVTHTENNPTPLNSDTIDGSSHENEFSSNPQYSSEDSQPVENISAVGDENNSFPVVSMETRHRVSPLVSSDIEDFPVVSGNDPLNANEMNSLSNTSLSSFNDELNDKTMLDPLSQFHFG